MARGIRFTKPEREAIRTAMGPAWDFWGPACGKKTLEASKSILAKLDASEHPVVKQRAGVLVRDAITAFRSVLDRRLIAPPNGAAGLFAQMQNRLNALGLTYEDCITIATQADKEWRTGNIKAQSLINQAEVLLSHATNGEAPLSSSGSHTPVEMEEW